MKKLIGVAALALCLCGCATEGKRYNPEAWYSPSDVDIGKIAAVNQWAEVHGATVMWINYPPKPKLEQTAGN
jgi:hypothetical protein